jgi:chaperonin GroEL
MTAAAGGGMVPGGGAAYLACQPAVRAAPAGEEDVAAGIACVARALEEPMRAIAANAGADPKTTVLRARESGLGFGFDARSGQIVDMRRSAILDSGEVLEQALRAAGSVSAMLLTTDVIVRHRNPKKVYED